MTMFAMSSPWIMGSDALLECVIMILMFLALEFPTAITRNICGTPFLSSISLIFLLTSMPFGLSPDGIGGWTWIIRHLGSAIGSWGVEWGGDSLVGFDVRGCSCLAGLAAMDAHVVHAGVAIGMACVSELRGCGCGVGVGRDSSSVDFLVKYTLVSDMNAMLG